MMKSNPPPKKSSGRWPVLFLGIVDYEVGNVGKQERPDHPLNEFQKVHNLFFTGFLPSKMGIVKEVDIGGVFVVHNVMD
jgi:hypothetical protein